MRWGSLWSLSPAEPAWGYPDGSAPPWAEPHEGGPEEQRRGGEEHPGPGIVEKPGAEDRGGEHQQPPDAGKNHREDREEQDRQREQGDRDQVRGRGLAVEDVHEGEPDPETAPGGGEQRCAPADEAFGDR